MTLNNKNKAVIIDYRAHESGIENPTRFLAGRPGWSDTVLATMAESDCPYKGGYCNSMNVRGKLIKGKPQGGCCNFSLIK